jgi:hypothetical protein
MCGRPVLKWSAAAIWYFVVSPSLEIVFRPGWSSALGRSGGGGEPIWWIRWTGSHWDVVLSEKVHGIQGWVAWHIIVMLKPGTGTWSVEDVSNKSKALQNGSVDSLIDILVLGKKFIMLQTYHNFLNFILLSPCIFTHLSFTNKCPNVNYFYSFISIVVFPYRVWSVDHLQGG